MSAIRIRQGKCWNGQLPHIQISEILATLRSVSVEYSGLHSMFSEFKLSFNELSNDSPPRLRYHVNRFDECFELIMIEVERLGAISIIIAFLEPAHNQAPAPEILNRLCKLWNFDGAN